MKKTIILLFALWCAGAVFGQNKDKEVAVMKPYIMGGATVKETDQLIMVGAMEEAFTKIEGYKAFSRTSQKLIEAEMAFQRSGKVADDEIKAVGQQAGVAYICTFTLAIDGNELVIKSSIIDVVTAQVINSKTVVCLDRTNRNDIIEKCESLPYKLLGVGNTNVTTAQTSSSGSNTGGGKHTNGAVWNPDGIEMVYVEGTGSGITAIKGFYIGKYEVTQAQWQAVMGNNPSNFKGSNYPVETVSWNDVQEFIKKLNAMTGRNYSLPTEAQWEYAANEGKNNSSYEYSGSNSIGTVAWYYDNSGNTTHPVGQKSPNALGIYDMTGNVWEWCQDCYDTSCSRRVLRGGSWNYIATICRVALRDYGTPDYRGSGIGFRLSLVP